MKRKAFGSVLVLIVLSVVLAFLTGLNTWSRLELKSTVDYSHQKQAYYSARSGVLAMIEALKTMDTLPETEFSVVGTMEGIGDNATDATFDATYTPPRGGFEGIVQATGYSGNGAFSETLRVEWSLLSEPMVLPHIISTEYAVFANGGVAMSGNGSVKGGVGSNAPNLLSGESFESSEDFFDFDGFGFYFSGSNYTLDGTLTIGPKGDPADFKTVHTINSSAVNVLPKEQHFPIPIMPPAPANTSTDLWTVSQQSTILSQDTTFSTIVIQGAKPKPCTVTFQTGSEGNTLRILTNSLSIDQHSTLQVEGDGKVQIIVLGSLSISGTVRGGEQIEVFYYGESSVTLDGKSSFDGFFYSFQGDIFLAGQAEGGRGYFLSPSPIKITLNGQFDNEMVIYAPLSEALLEGQGESINANVICEKAWISGKAKLTYVEDSDFEVEISQETSGDNSTEVFLWLETL